MKIILLSSLFFVLFSSSSYSLGREKCTDYSSEAKTTMGAKIIYSWCLREKSSFFNRSDVFNCAKKSADANSNFGAKLIFAWCKNKKKNKKKYKCAQEASSAKNDFSAKVIFGNCIKKK